MDAVWFLFELSQDSGAGLYRGTAMVKLQGAQTTQFFAAACAAGATMQRLRHDIAVSRVQGRHIGADHVHPSVAVGEL